MNYMDWQQIFGLTGGAMIALSFIPQICRLFKLKSAKEISLPYTILQLCGGGIWLTYGVIVSMLAIIVSNAVNCAMVVLILVAKIKYGR